MALQRVSEGRDFPGSEMSGEKENAFAPSVGALKIFKAVVDDDAGDIFARVARKEADLGKLPPQRNELSAHDAATLVRRHFGEGQSQVAESDSTQASVGSVDG